MGLTDWLYAVTDGTLAYYLAHTDGTQTKTQAWPYPVDPSLGIAAVTYSSVHDLDVSAFSSGKTAGALQTTFLRTGDYAALDQMEQRTGGMEKVLGHWVQTMLV